MKEITLEANIENIPIITEFVDKQLEELNCSLKAQTQIDIAIDELLSNIAHYAYTPKIGEVTVRVEVEQTPLSVIITFMDKGIPYDPLKASEPDITSSAQERKIGGLGIFLVKKNMNEIFYEYKNGQNILTIKKNI